MYYVEINSPIGWVLVCRFGPDDLDAAAAAARRYTLSSKCNSRVRDLTSYYRNEVGMLNIVFEHFYDRNNDPDARDDDPGAFGGWISYNEENDISWQECGF